MSLFKVRYKGLSDIREMSKKDLAAAGAGVDGVMRWEPANRHVVFVRDPDDRLLEIFKEEGTFTVTEVDEQNLNLEKETLITGQALDDTGQTVVSGTTGQRSSKGEPNADADPAPQGGSVTDAPTTSGTAGGSTSGARGGRGGRGGSGSSTNTNL